MIAEQRIRIFATSPQSKDVNSSEYRQRIIDVAQWSEEFGCTGILVYTDNGIVDPWQVAQVIVENTDSLSPLVEFNPYICTRIPSPRSSRRLPIFMAENSG